MKLKDLAATVKVDFVNVGFNPETEQTNFVCVINNQTFEFHCGLFACIPDKVPSALYTSGINPLYRLRRRYAMPSLGNVVKERAFDAIRQGKIKALPNWAVREVKEVYLDISKLCAPTAYDLLYCLKSDCAATSTSFDEWCGEYGYSNDSIKALTIYNTCIENARKLRKALGHDTFKKLMESEDE